MDTVFIYALKDPRDGAVRYIGKAKSPEKRMHGHKFMSKKKSTHVQCWISLLHKLGFSPILEIVDEVPAGRWQFFERAYIRGYQEAGANLTNLTEGGDGVLMTPEIQAEAGRRSGETRRGMIHSLEWGANIAASLKGKKHSPERCAAQTGEKNPMFGKRHTPESRARMSRSQTGQKQSAETVAKKVAKNTGQKRSLESRANMSAGRARAKAEREKNVLQ